MTTLTSRVTAGKRKRVHPLIKRIIAAGGKLQVRTWNQFQQWQTALVREGGHYGRKSQRSGGTIYRVTIRAGRDEELTVEFTASN